MVFHMVHGSYMVEFLDVGRIYMAHGIQTAFGHRGPYKGEGSGGYVPIEPGNEAYIKAYEIPYGSW